MDAQSTSMDAVHLVASSDVPSIERPLGPPAIDKPDGWQLFRNMGSPKFVVAPMVDQSELVRHHLTSRAHTVRLTVTFAFLPPFRIILSEPRNSKLQAWRVLSRLHGASIAYTPMIHSGLFSSESNTRYRTEQFDLASGEEGKAGLDRPLVAQFCSNNKDTFLRAASLLGNSGQVDAVDLNLGCPQGIAKRGNYGAFLMEDWTLVSSMIRHLHENLSVPITAKFRVYDSLEKTLEYARMLEASGAQILTVHGRTRDQKGQLTGLADWAKIAAVKAAVKVPVYANGNVLCAADARRLLEATGVDGVMSAEGNLYNPAIFEPPERDAAKAYRAALSSTLPGGLSDALDAIDAQYTSHEDAAYHPITQLSRQYLAIAAHLRTRTAVSAMKAHLFRMWKPVFNAGKHLELRDQLGTVSALGAEEDIVWKSAVDKLNQLTDDLARRLQDDYSSGVLTLDPTVVLPEAHDTRQVPYSHCQSCVRPLSQADAEKAMKRGLAEPGRSGSPAREGDLASDSKRAKLDGQDAFGEQNGSNGIQLLPEVEKCPVCKDNNASRRCARKICKKCCLETEAAELKAGAEATTSSATSHLQKGAAEAGTETKSDSLASLQAEKAANSGADLAELATPSNNGQASVTRCEAHAAKVQKVQDKKARAQASKESRRAAKRETKRDLSSKRANGVPISKDAQAVAAV